MIRLKELISEKTLYHGTIINNVKNIEKYGLVPTAGVNWLKRWLRNYFRVLGYAKAEDCGSISVVVPNGNYVKEI